MTKENYDELMSWPDKLNVQCEDMSVRRLATKFQTDETV